MNDCVRKKLNNRKGGGITFVKNLPKQIDFRFLSVVAQQMSRMDFLAENFSFCQQLLFLVDDNA